MLKDGGAPIRGSMYLGSENKEAKDMVSVKDVDAPISESMYLGSENKEARYMVIVERRRRSHQWVNVLGF